jgi:putative transposase
VTFGYLPPYSPHLHPIEKLWSKVRAWRRDLSASTADLIRDANADALRAVAPDDCSNYFTSGGYGDG